MKYANKYIIANWKTNPQTLDDAKELIKTGKALGEKIAHYAVPAPFLGDLAKDFSPVIGAQTVSGLEGGAETGLFTAQQLKEVGATFTLLGHSEDRRRGATDEFVNNAVKMGIKHELYSCLCVGELEMEKFQEEITAQLNLNLSGIDTQDLSKMMFAYEPVWAIGAEAKRPATTEEIVDRISFIKGYLKDKFEVEQSYVIYGGSVDDKNIEEILSLDICDGVLIGRASADKEKWKKLVDLIK